MVAAPDEISEVWAVHFEKVLNRPNPLNTAYIPTTANCDIWRGISLLSVLGKLFSQQC